MGKRSFAENKEFTINDAHNKALIIKMLQYEDIFSKNEGQAFYKNPIYRPYISLDIILTINRIVLDKFGYDTSDTSVENYRCIFNIYFKSSDDYDKEVMQSVHYMRENKCIYYKNPPIKIGQIIPNCELTKLNGKTKTTLYNAIKNEDGRYTVFAAFSLS